MLFTRKTTTVHLSNLILVDVSQGFALKPPSSSNSLSCVAYNIMCGVQLAFCVAYADYFMSIDFLVLSFECRPSTSFYL